MNRSWLYEILKVDDITNLIINDPKCEIVKQYPKMLVI